MADEANVNEVSTLEELEEKGTKVVWADNITFLAKEKKIKLMDLAEKAGIAGSFFSRARKGDSRADADVLMKIADELGVSLDILMKCDMTALNKNERIILNTIYKVTQETLEEKAAWARVPKELMRQVDSNHVPVLPFCQTYEKDGSEYIRFQSLFDTQETSASVDGDIYSVSLTNWVQLYLVPVRVEEKREESDGWASTYQDGMELYLATTEGQKSPICCSYRGMREEIVQKLNELYDIVKKRDGQGALAPDAVEVLSSYLDGKLTDKFTIETDELPF